MSTYVVDRIEGTVAALVGENAPDLMVELALLPAGTKEGSVVRNEGGVYVLDSTEEQRRRQRISSLQEKLRRKTSL